MISSIRSKLVLFSLVSILLTLVIVGVSFDLLLRSQHHQAARKEILHTYEVISNQLGNFAASVIELSHQLASDESLIATVNLINRYQDPQHYRPLVFDPEKKNAALYLLKQILATPGMIAALYDKRGQLVLYVLHDANGTISGISSYHQGQQLYLSVDTHSERWEPRALPKLLDSQHPVVTQTGSPLIDPESVSYFSSDERLVIQGDHPIRQSRSSGETETIGYVTLLKPVGLAFLKEAPLNTRATLSLLLANGTTINPVTPALASNLLHARSQPMGSTTINDMMWADQSSHYLQSYIIPALNGDIYLIIALAKDELLKALNQVRLVLLLIFIFTAVMLLSLSYYWLNKLVTRPLLSLVKHAKEIENGTSSSIPAHHSNDEVDQLSRVLNSMVTSITRHEAELTNTQRALSEAQHIAKIGSWEHNLNDDRVTWSREMYNILNLDPQQHSPYPQAITDFIHPDDRDRVVQARLAAQKSFSDCSINYRLILADDTIKHIHELTRYHPDDSGELVCASGILQDVTEQHDKDLILRRSQKMDALGQLTGGIAHDFNNMLGVILGFTELLQLRSKNDDKLQKYSDNIHSAAERAKRLTSKLLAFSRTKPLSAELTDINTLLHEQQQILAKALTARIELVYELADQLWPVYVEKGGLEDAILNMGLNAMHAMPEQGRLTLRTCNRHLNHNEAMHLNLTAGDYVTLSLIDTGSGMSDETLEHLFDPFYTTKGNKGTGLGMSQVYAFIRQSGGFITVTSQQGKGTHIDIYLPRSSNPGIPSTSCSADAQVADYSGFETILLVDDEAAIREFEQEMLAPQGYTIYSAESGAKALEILATTPVDLVLSDVVMPEMDGYQLSARVAELYPNTRFTLASGYTDDTNQGLADAALRHNILKKPFTSTELLRHVRESLDRNPPANTPQLIEWSDKFLTGISPVDRDHKHLIDICHKCHALANSSNNHEELASLLYELLDYTSYHFRREELIMQACNYPHFATHQRAHQQISQQIQGRLKLYDEGKLDTSSLLRLLRLWISSHILGMDRDFAPYCEGKDELITRTLSQDE